MSPRTRLPTIVLLAALLAGCGVRTAYNNADWLVMRWVNDRVTLTEQQDRALRSALEEHLAWHCASELPDYAEFLRQVRLDIATDRISTETLERYGEQTSEFGQRLLARIRPSLIDLLASLDQHQVAELMDSLEQRNRELAEEAERAGEALQEARVRAMERGMRRFTGRLTNEQRERLQAWAAELDDTASLVLEQRLDWQARLAKALSIRHDRTAFDSAMAELLRPDSGDWSVLETRRNANRERTLRALADLHSISPDRQVRRVTHRLDELASDLRQLSCG